MKNQSRVVVLFVILLSLLNIWLLYINQVRQDLINNLTKVQSQASHPCEKPKTWGFEQTGNEVAQVVHTGVELPREGISLVVFFTESGCSYCVDHEVKLLNDFNKKFEDTFDVYLMSHNESFLARLHGAEFSYSTINPEEKLLDQDFEFYNPVAVILDSSGKVQIIHIAEKDNKEKSNQFYNRISSLLLSLKH